MLPIKQYPNKYTANYRCPDKIKHFKIRIKIREVEVPTGKIEEDNSKWTERTFKWQEKVYSRMEKDLYLDLKNCTTDLDREHNQNVQEAVKKNQGDFLFTYTNEDHYEFDKVETVSKLQKMMDALDINNSPLHDYDMEKSILYSMDNPVPYKCEEKMFIMADFGDYVETTWVPQEQPLCILKYETSGVLQIYPDFTKKRPYLITPDRDSKKCFYYYIENASETPNEGMLLKEQELYNKLVSNQIANKKSLIGKDFFLPPKNKLFVYMFIEILYGKNFEHSQIYVKYTIHLPNNWSINDPTQLQGLTQIACGKDEERLVHFGHNFEVVLENNIQTKGLPDCPYIYFEVVSKDRWDVCRNEGLTYKAVPISQPGIHEYELGCFRFGRNGLVGDLRRFFIGDCSNYEDVRWIGVSKEQDDKVINKFGINTVGTGSLKVRFNVLHQSQAFLDKFAGDGFKNREGMIFDKLKASSLIKSVEEVLQAFKKARKNMLEARQQI